MALIKETRRFRVGWLVYLLVAIGFISLLVKVTRDELARNPEREAAADLGSQGFVTIRFSSDPYPPLPSGTVTLKFTPMNARGVTIPIDSLTYEYGLAGSDQVLGSGTAQPMADNSGVLMAGAQFSSPGNWWLRATVALGNSQGEVLFTFYVEPAQ